MADETIRVEFDCVNCHCLNKIGVKLRTEDVPIVQQATVTGLEKFCLPVWPGRHLDTDESLEPCKHCGHEAGFRDAQLGPYEFNISVECSNTSCGVKTPSHYKDRPSAAKAWNRKAP